MTDHRRLPSAEVLALHSDIFYIDEVFSKELKVMMIYD